MIGAALLEPTYPTMPHISCPPIPWHTAAFAVRRWICERAGNQLLLPSISLVISMLGARPKAPLRALAPLIFAAASACAGQGSTEAGNSDTPSGVSLGT